MADPEDGEERIPVIHEELEVGARKVRTGQVRVEKRVQAVPERVTGELRGEEVEVERVPLDRPVAGPLEPRIEGDCTVIPVVEEVLVVEKRWVLREELRIRKRRVVRPFEETVVLRKEEAVVERRKP